MNDKWCWHWTIRRPPTDKAHLVGTTACGEWVCECGHLFKWHIEDGVGRHNECKYFKFKHNDNCTIECQFLFKLYQPTNKLLNGEY